MLFDHTLNESAQNSLPEWAIQLFTYVTDVGDPLFVVLVVAAVYLFVDHDRGIFAIAMTFAAYGVTVGLKELLAISRPPAEVQLIEASGYGIPSGHALGTIILFGVLAMELDVWKKTHRYAVATGLVAFVSVSRIVLGVHYVEDVIVGLAIGLALLAAVYRYEWRRPMALFGIGLVGSVGAMALSQLSYAHAIVLFGFSFGAAIAWPLLDPIPRSSRRAAVATGIVVLPVATLLMPLGPTVFLSTLTVIPLSMAAIVLILGGPTLASRIDRTERFPI